MRASRAVLSLILLSASLAAWSVCLSDTVQDTPPRTLYTVRVIYLQGMDPMEALSQVRHSVQLRHLVVIKERDAMVISDPEDVVDQAEKLLRDLKVVVRTVDPHAPLFTDELMNHPDATRVFLVEAESVKTVWSVLKAIYQVRNVQKSEQDGSLTIQAAQIILDDSEALLRELGLLKGH